MSSRATTNYHDESYSYNDDIDDDDDDHNDDIWHFLVGFAWTLLFYSALTLYCCLYRTSSSSSSRLRRRSQKEILRQDLRLLIAAALSFVLGLLEEVICSVWGSMRVVPWRTSNNNNNDDNNSQAASTNKFDIWNVGLHLNGIVAAVLLLLVLIHVLRTCRPAPSNDGATVASNESAEHDENEDDDLNDLEKTYEDVELQGETDDSVLSTSSSSSQKKDDDQLPSHEQDDDPSLM